MAVDDDALNKGNINDEVAMRKAKKAEYNNRTREKKRQALLDEVDKAEYKNRTHKKKRSDIVEDFDKESRNKPKGRPKKKSTHNSGRITFDLPPLRSEDLARRRKGLLR
ncbi:hypothetical protein Ae201684P_009366 [Aphanomyces euteiches]|nr:hypothetical protein Ae201684P_009366 [Aphanomyces euteiches]